MKQRTEEETISITTLKYLREKVRHFPKISDI